MTHFQEFWGEVRNKDAETIRAEVEKMVSQVTFCNWSSGRFEPDSKFWLQINEIATRYGYNKPYQV